MAAVRMELAGQSGGGDQIRHEYVLVTNGGWTDEDVIDWINDPAATWSEFVDDPSQADPDTKQSKPGYPISSTYGDRELLRSPEYQALNFGDIRRWKITATYGYPDGSTRSPLQGLGAANATFAFEAGPDIDRVKYSLETVAEFPATGVDLVDSPKTNRAINIRSDGTIEGVQFPQGQPITLTYANNSSWFTAAKRQAISRARGSVNSSTLTLGGLSYAAGEARFLGARGKISNNGESAIDLQFSIIENETDVRFPGIDHTAGADSGGSPLTQIDVDGWDYLWVYYGRGVSGSALTAKPRLLLVERIFKRVDLNALFA